MTVRLDANNRVNPIFENCAHWPAHLQRMANLALPFLDLCPSTALASRVIVGGTRAYSLVKEWHASGSNRKTVTELAKLTGSVGAAILFPKGGAIAAQLLEVYSHLASSRGVGWKHELLQALHGVIYLASLTVGGPEIVALSMLAQACVEIYRAWEEWSKPENRTQKFGPYPEVAANLLLAGIRLSRAIPEVRNAYLDRFGEELSQEELDDILCAVVDPWIDLAVDLPLKTKEGAPLKKAALGDVLSALERMQAPPSKEIAEARATATRLAHWYAHQLLSRRKPSVIAFDGTLRIRLSRGFWDHYPDRASFLRAKGGIVDRFTENYCTLFLQHFAKHKGKNEVDFAKVLHDKGYSTKLSRLDFSHKDLSSVYFRAIEFNHCTFDNAHCTGATFKGVQLNNCAFNRVNAVESHWEEVVLKETSLCDSAWLGAQLSGVIFDGVDASGAQFTFAKFRDSVLFRCAKLFETAFLGTSGNAILMRCDLTDALLCDAKERFTTIGCTPHRITRPVLAQGWNFRHPLSFAKLQKTRLQSGWDVICLHYDLRHCDIVPEALDDEVAHMLREARHTDISLPKELLARAPAGSSIQRVQGIARTILQHADGLLLPGGADVEPEWYGEKRLAGTRTEPDYRRSTLEFALLAAAEEKQMPVLGICRGFQMGAIFYGGRMTQDLGDHFDRVQKLEPNDSQPAAIPFLSKLMGKGEPLYGLSMHRQGVRKDDLGPVLASALEKEGVIKCAITPDERALFVQFHPEAFASQARLRNNKRFFDIFLNNVRSYKETR